MPSLPSPPPNGFVCMGYFHIKEMTVCEYRSTITAVRLFVVDVPSPIVHGYFALPTEAHDNEGLPHTLEHLVFLGSHKYPHKGLLDLMANRCLSQGTNAWTETDHTAYTLTCAGEEGFCNLLPVYLDHVMRPTLEESAFLTEVHHVKQDGSSSGVVYSEMESRENTANCMIQREMCRLLYPGDCGYKYETGGLLNDIRSTNNDRVRSYHKQYYRWDNLNIILTGRVDAVHAMEIISSVESTYKQTHSDYNTDMPTWTSTTTPPPTTTTPTTTTPTTTPTTTTYQNNNIGIEKNEKEKEKTKNSGCPSLSPVSDISSMHNRISIITRPWRGQVEHLTTTEISEVHFPSDDELTGKVTVGWRSPDWKDFFATEVIDLLGSYLTEGNIAPLHMSLVEADPPFCSSVSYSQQAFRSPFFDLFLDDVPTEKLSTAATEIKTTINQLLIENGKQFDIKRMRGLVRRELLQYQRSLEIEPHETFSDLLIEYCVNSDGGIDELKDLCNREDLYEKLINMEKSVWLQSLRLYFMDSVCVEVRGIPSKQKAKELQEEAENLKKKQIETIGGEKLKVIANAVSCAQTEQQIPPPLDVILSIPIANAAIVKLPEAAVASNLLLVEDNNNNNGC
eukprot:GHVS01060785.1.p1 GENE.GHVS01060785.1~~GHVS01060785.1.p1  ORF type:complete len:621 (+),score=116.60 GHVS01060785.1:127-1989(+)